MNAGIELLSMLSAFPPPLSSLKDVVLAQLLQSSKKNFIPEFRYAPFSKHTF